jgi:hypothetical protein
VPNIGGNGRDRPARAELLRARAKSPASESVIWTAWWLWKSVSAVSFCAARSHKLAPCQTTILPRPEISITTA